MLKVVIADDEVRVCRLVQMLADWDALGMEVVGTASNGLEALELVKTLSPDILVTDIRMPGCGGMELIDKAKEFSPNLEIVLISGYAQFEYAQTAMRYDVGGYILKPIKKDILTSILEKLGNKCRARKNSADVLSRLRQDSTKNSSLLRSRLPRDLLQNRIDTFSVERLDSEYGFSFTEGLLQVFILKTDCSYEKLNSPAMDILKSKVYEKFESFISPLCLSGVFQFHGSAGYGVINYMPEKSAELRRGFRETLNRLEAQKPIFGSVEFSLAIGRAVDTAEGLTDSMREARLGIAERIVEGCGRLLEIAPPSDIDTRKLLDKYHKAISYAVETLSAEDADNAARELEHGVEAVAGVRGFEITELVLAAGKTFALLVNTDEREILRDFEMRCELCSRASQLFDCLAEFTKGRLEVARDVRESDVTRPIRLAKQYIHKHYSEPITLEDVCAVTSFSVSYFSTLFKKETGEGFLKYLTRVRIENAKTLLRETTLPIEEICNQVGYHDLKHFTNTFKKMTSLNPGQYRKLYG